VAESLAALGSSSRVEVRRDRIKVGISVFSSFRCRRLISLAEASRNGFEGPQALVVIPARRGEFRVSRQRAAIQAVFGDD
jgi:hypothetical protein